MAKARALPRNLVPSAAQAVEAARSPHLTAEPTTERAVALHAFTPTYGHRLPESARAVLINLVLAMPFKTALRDLKLLGAITDIATYEYGISREVDPAHLFTESTIKRWRKESLDKRGVRPRSQGDYASLVRAVAKHAGLAPHLTERLTAPRGKAIPPADKQAWGRALDEASRLPEPLRTDATMLADLTFGVGMRRDEVGRARLDDLYLLPHDEGSMRVINRHGVVRDVPVGPYVTQKIRRAERKPEDFLFRPKNSRNANLINHFFARVAKRSPSATFDPIAARNRFIVDLLAQPIPFSVVAHLADIQSGGHTAQDLARYITLPSQRDIMEYVRGSWR